MIGSSENRVSYNGNGNAKEFAFEFKILNASDIKVLLVNADGTEKLLTKDYFVDIEKSVVRYPGYAPGAELPLEQQPPILPAGSKLVLYREVPITQQTKLDQFWPFNVIEAALDKLTIICQQLSDGFSRCLKLSESVPKDVNPTIPVEVGKSFRWSDDGKKIVLTDDPAKVLPQANEVLKRTEAARDVAVAKADAAGASAVSAAESEVAADRSATQAEAAKTNAKASEVAAKASQDAAKVSEGKAKTSETNALTHENNAKASADKAKASETNAADSASTASAKASAASASAAAAKASETKAKTSETNAKASELKSKDWAVKSDGVVEDGKYSSYHYSTIATQQAAEAKEQADRAEQISESLNGLAGIKGLATKAEAEAGVVNDKVMTPLRVKESIKVNAPVKSVNGVVAGANGDVVIDAGVPIGFEYFSTNPNIQAGSIPLMGGLYSRTTYADLWVWVQQQKGYLLTESEWQQKATANSGNVPFYSDGDGATTFRVPALSCWVRGAKGLEEFGRYLAAGLPNITGTIPIGAYNGSDNDNREWQYGAFKNANDTTFNSGDSYSSGCHYKVEFDASLSNPLYGNTNTVQPQSIVGMWLVKAYGSVSNVGSTDVADVAQGLTELETRVGNLKNEVNGMTDYIVESYRNGTTWWRKYKSGWIEQGWEWDGTAGVGSKFIITLIKPMADENYSVHRQVVGLYNAESYSRECAVYEVTPTQFAVYNGIRQKNRFYVCGQGA